MISTSNRNSVGVRKRIGVGAGRFSHAPALGPVARELVSSGVGSFSDQVLDAMYFGDGQSIQGTVNSEYVSVGKTIRVGAGAANYYSNVYPAHGVKRTIVLNKNNSFAYLEVDINHVHTSELEPTFASRVDPRKASLNRDQHLYSCISHICCELFETLRQSGVTIEWDGPGYIYGITLEALVTCFSELRVRVVEGAVNYRYFVDEYPDWRQIKKTEMAMCMMSHIQHHFYHECEDELLLSPSLLALASNAACVVAKGVLPPPAGFDNIVGTTRYKIEDGEKSWIMVPALARLYVDALQPCSLLYKDEWLLWGDAPPSNEVLAYISRTLGERAPDGTTPECRVRLHDGEVTTHYRVLFNNQHNMVIGGQDFTLGAFSIAIVKMAAQAISFCFFLHGGYAKNMPHGNVANTFASLLLKPYKKNDAEAALVQNCGRWAGDALAYAGGGAGPRYEELKQFAYQSELHERHDLPRFTRAFGSAVASTLQILKPKQESAVIDLLAGQEKTKWEEDFVPWTPQTQRMLQFILKHREDKLSQLREHYARMAQPVCVELFSVADDVDTIRKDIMDTRFLCSTSMTALEQDKLDVIMYNDTQMPDWENDDTALLNFAASFC
jgi:hypothetical protein